MTTILTLPLVRLEIATSYDADWRTDFYVIDAEAAPVNLSGITFTLSVWRLETGATRRGHERLLEATLENDEVTVGGENFNLFSISIPAARMDKIPTGQWPMEVIGEADGATVEFVLGSITHGLSGGSLITASSLISRLPVTIGPGLDETILTEDSSLTGEA